MSIDINKIMKLNDQITTAFRRKHIIVLDPGVNNEEKLKSNMDMIYDKIDWKMPEQIQVLVEELSQNNQLNNEEKILLIYEKICKDYVYDDNLISYIQKTDDDSYYLPDWYGRDIKKEWEDNREKHNRRVCYEVSRYLAKALIEMFKDNEDFNTCILWDRGHTHYFVGITCDDYDLTIDSDNFNNIKDLTRIKTGLTAEGIVILRDKEEKFKNVLDKFNESRMSDAKEKIEDDIKDDNNEINPNLDSIQESDQVLFIRNAIEILKNKYNLDSQGIFEYMKEIVDINIGPQARTKVWKEIEGNESEDTRYIRCLILDIDNKKYLIDVEKAILREFDEKELKGEDRDFIPYKELTSEQVSSYRSRKEERYSGR